MSLGLRIFLIVISCIAGYCIFKSVLKQQITGRQSLIWFFLAGLLALCGIFPMLPVMTAKVLHVQYAPSMVFMLSVIFLTIALYNCFRVNADLKKKINELAIQISLLNQEQSELKKLTDSQLTDQRSKEIEVAIDRQFKMQRVLFVINTLGKAGAEMAMVELMKKLISEGKEIYLQVMIPIGVMGDLIPSGVHMLNGNRYNVPLFSKDGQKLMRQFLIKCFFSGFTGFRLLPYMIRNAMLQKKTNGRVQPDKVLWRLIAETAQVRKERYDLAIAFLEGASTYYVANHVNADKKAAFVHIDYKESGYLPFMDGGCYDSYDSIFTVSAQAKEKFLEVYPQYATKTELFYNIINADKIRMKADCEGFTDAFSGTRLITVGRLHYQKAYDVAIDACAQLIRDGYNVRWYVFGDGQEKEKLLNKIEQTGMKEHFVLMGATSNPYPFVKQADIYLQATRFEGKSIAVEEAQVLGKPIIASNCTGNLEQITNGINGIIVTLTPESIAKAIEELIDHPETAQKYAAYNAAKQWNGEEDMQKIRRLLEGEKK